jgi:hypothetical protein
VSDPPDTRPGPDPLIEAALTAWRARAPDGRILASPAWADLEPAGRRQLFEDMLAARRLEQALDPLGLSTTARAILDRIESAQGE